MKVEITVAIIGALASVAGSLIVAKAATKKSTEAAEANHLATEQVKTQVETARREATASSPGRLDEGQKICRVYAPNMFSDTLIVPKAWTSRHCAQLAKAEGALVVVLGCAYENDVVFGEDGAAPLRNCGW